MKPFLVIVALLAALSEIQAERLGGLPAPHGPSAIVGGQSVTKEFSAVERILAWKPENRTFWNSDDTWWPCTGTLIHRYQLREAIRGFDGH